MTIMSGGQSYDFYLLTTGLPIDPVEGTLAKYYYNVFVKAIGLQADILLQHDVRTINNIDVTEFLPAYTQNPRNCYQLLIGVAGCSDPFTRESLIRAIETYALTQAEPHVGWLKPKVGDYSFDPIATFDIDNSFTILRCISGAWSTQTFNAFYSDDRPTELDGHPNSIWVVNVNGQLKFYFNDPNKGWAPISKYGHVTFSGTAPALVNGDWWIIPTGFNFRQFNGTTWGSLIPYTFSSTAPVGNYWLAPVNSHMLELRVLKNSIWTPTKLSKAAVKIQSGNSNFLSVYSSAAYNYTIDVEPLALYGGPIIQGSSTVTVTTYNEAVATGAVDELFVNFFTHLPIIGSEIVFINGEEQLPEGYVIAGQNIQFIDAINGFSLTAGDQILCHYEYSV